MVKEKSDFHPISVLKIVKILPPAIYDACQASLNVRMGDLRYHQVTVIPTSNSFSLGDLYRLEDPLTGETIAASINVWSHVNDLWSQKIIDTLRYMKGELSTEE